MGLPEDERNSLSWHKIQVTRRCVINATSVLLAPQHTGKWFSSESVLKIIFKSFQIIYKY